MRLTRNPENRNLRLSKYFNIDIIFVGLGIVYLVLYLVVLEE